MKIGYSNMLGDYVQAIELDYDCCKEFDIVCPCCREKVKKGVLSLDGGGETHYLSHFKARPRAENAECELRVSKLTPEFLAAHSAQARKQSLEKMLLMFREAISASAMSTIMNEVVSFKGEAELSPCAQETMRNLLGNANGADAAFEVARRLKRATNKITNSKTFTAVWHATLKGFLRKNIEDGCHKGLISRLIDVGDTSCLSNLRDAKNAQYIDDVLKHLATEQAEANLKYLTATSIAAFGLMTYGVVQEVEVNKTSNETYIVKYFVHKMIDVLAMDNPTKANGKLAELDRNPWFKAKFGAPVSRFMIGELVSSPPIHTQTYAQVPDVNTCCRLPPPVSP